MDETAMRGIPRSLNDDEGPCVPVGLPPVVDAHVHVFPDRLFDTVRAWFDAFAWDIRYRMPSRDVVRYLLARGVEHVVALQYAHKAGISRRLNEYMAELCSEFHPRVTGLATVFPGEDGCKDILREAFAMGLKGVKLHAHVQCFDVDGRPSREIYEVCASENKPLVVHASREPKSNAYLCDPYLLCSATKVERVLRDFPGLRLCVPHLGVDEFEAYRRLLERFDNIWVDTAMVMAGYFPVEPPFMLCELRRDRVMYGSDFPNIPYAWDRELSRIRLSGLPGDFLERLLHANAGEFFGISTGRAPRS